MKISSASPYLITGGKSERAIELYKRAFNARLEDLKRFGDVDESCSDAVASRVMHASLRLGDALIMLSDGPHDMETPTGTLVNVALDFADESEMRQSFDELSKGGRTLEAIFDAPWGGLFGAVVDEIGVHWMFACPRSA